MTVIEARCKELPRGGKRYICGRCSGLLGTSDDDSGRPAAEREMEHPNGYRPDPASFRARPGWEMAERPPGYAVLPPQRRSRLRRGAQATVVEGKRQRRPALLQLPVIATPLGNIGGPHYGSPVPIATPVVVRCICGVQNRVAHSE